MSDTIIVYENGKAIGGEGHPTNADEITFNNEGTDLVSEETESAIKEVNAKFDKGSVSVTANGVKTIGALLTELFALIDLTKVTKDTTLVWTTGGAEVFDHIMLKAPTSLVFTRMYVGTTWSLETFNVDHISSSLFDTANGATPVNKTSTVPANGETYSIYY